METPNTIGRAADGPNDGRRRVDRVLKPDWQIELERQERSFGWLGRHTDRSASAVARYASGSLTPPAGWLADARRVLGMEAAA